MGAEDRQVGVVRLALLIAVAVDDGQVVVVVLLADKAAGVLAEGAHLVAEGQGIANQLALIQSTVDFLHYLVAHLHAHAYIHRAGLMGDVMLLAEPLQPVGPAPPGGDDGGIRRDLKAFPAPGLFDLNAEAGPVLQHQVGAAVAEEYLDTVIDQVMLNGAVNLLRLFCAHVADGAIHQLEPGADGAGADLLDLFPRGNAFDMVLRPELQVDLIGIVDHALGILLAQQLGQLAADFVGKRQLAVRKRARARETRGDMTGGLAVDAAAGLVLGAVPFFNGSALLHHDDAALASPPDQLQGSKNAGRAGADDDQIAMHAFPPPCCFDVFFVSALLKGSLILSYSKRGKSESQIMFPPKSVHCP